MEKLTLYHAAPSRSSIVRWMLEEVGEPYDLHVLKLAKGEQHAPELSRRQSHGQGAGPEAWRHGRHRSGGHLHLSGR